MATSSYPEPKRGLASTNGVDERLGLSELVAFAKHKTVPQHKHSFGITGAEFRCACSSFSCYGNPAAGLLPARQGSL